MRRVTISPEKMSELPNNPYMLVSAVNMLLRDGEFESLEELCAYYDRDSEEVKQALMAHGFEYDEEQKQFK